MKGAAGLPWLHWQSQGGKTFQESCSAPATRPRQARQRLLAIHIWDIFSNKPSLLLFQNGLRNTEQAACLPPPMGGTSLPRKLSGGRARSWGKATLKATPKLCWCQDLERLGRPAPSLATPGPLIGPQKLEKTQGASQKPEKMQGPSQAVEPSAHPTQQPPQGQVPHLLLWCLPQQGPDTRPGVHSAVTNTRLAGQGDPLTARSPCHRKGHQLTSVPRHPDQRFRATCHHLAPPASSAPGCAAEAQAEQEPHPSPHAHSSEDIAYPSAQPCPVLLTQASPGADRAALEIQHDQTKTKGPW